MRHFSWKILLVIECRACYAALSGINVKKHNGNEVRKSLPRQPAKLAEDSYARAFSAYSDDGLPYISSLHEAGIYVKCANSVALLLFILGDRDTLQVECRHRCHRQKRGSHRLGTPSILCTQFDNHFGIIRIDPIEVKVF